MSLESNLGPNTFYRQCLFSSSGDWASFWFFIRRMKFSQKCQWQFLYHHLQRCCGSAAPCWAPVFMQGEMWAPWSRGHSFNGRNAAHAVRQCVSHTHIQAEIPWPVILVVRDSSFRWEELVLKGEKGLFLQCRVERGASVGLSKAQGQKVRLTHRHHTRSHMRLWYRLHTISKGHRWDAHM